MRGVITTDARALSTTISTAITNNISALSHRFGDEAVFEAVSLIDTSVDANIFPLLSIGCQGIGAIERGIRGIFYNLR